MCQQFSISRNYRILSIMLWAFPYLLWQAFGNWSGFIVGVMVSVILTAMLNGLFRYQRSTAAHTRQQPVQTAEPQTNEREEQQEQSDSYQRGYRAETEPYRAEQQSYQTQELQPQYEEVQVQYPQELPPRT